MVVADGSTAWCTNAGSMLRARSVRKRSRRHSSSILVPAYSRVGSEDREQRRASAFDLAPEARVENSIIGDRAAVGPGVHLSNCVVFEDTHVESRSALDHCIITPGWYIDCRAAMPVAQVRS